MLCVSNTIKKKSLSEEEKNRNLVQETKKGIRKLIHFIFVERVLNSEFSYQYNCNQYLKCFARESLAKYLFGWVHVEKRISV